MVRRLSTDDATSVERVLKILRRLMVAPSTVRELIAFCGGMSAKSIRRDLIAIRAAGFPLRVTVEKHGAKRYRVLRSLASWDLTPTDAE